MKLVNRVLRAFEAAWLLNTAVLSVTHAQPASDPVPEILVEAPEPKYVAPTLRDRIGRIWAPVLIDGKGPFRLVLDTGASRSAVTAHVAAALMTGYADASGKPLTLILNGVTGTAVVPAIQVNRLEVGELLIDATTLPIVADAFGGAEGVLGREGLLDKRITADFLHDRLVIRRSHGERANSGYTVLPVKLTQAGLLAANVRIGTVKVKAIIDTGGQQTVGNLALSRALMRHSTLDARPEDIIGITQDPQPGTNVQVPALTFGALRIQNIRITFGDMYLFQLLKFSDEPTVLIGMDVLGLFDTLIIDYKLREVQIRTRDAPGGVRVGAESGLGRTGS